MNDPVARGMRWNAFYEEDGGLRDMLADMRDAYLKRMSEIDFGNDKKLEKVAALAMAARITKEIDAVVRGVISDGQSAKAQREHVQQIESLPKSRRRWI